MRFFPLSYLLSVLIAFASISCGDDPELVEKREQQKAEISRLRGELALIEEKLKNLPPDVSAELPEAKRLVTTQTAEIAALETEIATLETRKKSLQSEFDAYQAKYKIK